MTRSVSLLFSRSASPAHLYRSNTYGRLSEVKTLDPVVRSKCRWGEKELPVLPTCRDPLIPSPESPF